MKTWMKMFINFGELSSKYRVSMVMEAKQGVEMSEGRNVQKKLTCFVEILAFTN